jgi:hypothetical protein
MTPKVLDLPLPDPARPPMIANIFHAVRHANTKLMPMFPYCQDGCIVPGASVFSGGRGRGIGAFHHENSVDEVSIVFASVGGGIRTGDVFVGAREHLVGAFFHEEEGENNLMVIAVVQRQAEAGIPQSESLSFLCEKCQSTLLRHGYSGKSEQSHNEPAGDRAPPLETLTEGALWAREFNDSQDLRTCKQCGHVNPPFPLHIWGWDEYRTNYVAAEKARQLYLQQARSRGLRRDSNAAT